MGVRREAQERLDRQQRRQAIENHAAERRRQVAIGIHQADRGELAPIDPQATLARPRVSRL